MAELWIATANRKKRAELERLLAPLGLALRTLDDLGQPFTVDEDAPDFAGNARKKAAALAQLVRAPALGDDSGLVVDALGGRPGVHSARYGGPGLDDRGRLSRLLEELREVPDEHRTARFVCSLCLCDGDGSVRFATEAVCEGFLITTPRGADGFGYDPAFVVTEQRARPDARTFAQLTAAEKDLVSHRGKALAALAHHLRAQPLHSPATRPESRQDSRPDPRL